MRLLFTLVLVALVGVMLIPNAFAENLYYYVEPLPSWGFHASSAVDSATKAWEDAKPGLQFVEVSPSQHSDFTIDWVKDLGPQKLGHTLGQSYVAIGLGDSECNNTWYPYSEKYITETTIHEIGHILGLEHDNDPNSVMYEFGTNKEYEIIEDGFTLTIKNGVCVVEEKKKGGGCLIATAAFGSELAPHVQQLRELRDNKLLQTEFGSSFMSSFNSFYYSFSPIIADWERDNLIFKEAVKITITPLLTSLLILNYVDMDSEAEALGYGISIILLNIGIYFAPLAIIIIKVRRKTEKAI